MGAITDFFIAADDDVQLIDWADSDADPLQSMPSLRAKWIDPIKLATLEAILKRTPCEQGIICMGQMLWQDGDGGSWVSDIPDALTTLLAGVDAKDVPVIAHKWSETQELKAYHFTRDDAQQIIAGLVRLAQQARNTGKRLFLFTSL